MKKFYLAITALLLIGAVLLGLGNRKYNLLLISVNSLRPDVVKTSAPNLSKLSGISTVFDNAYTIYPETVGSHYTLMTGNSYIVKDEVATLKFIENFDQTRNKDYANLASKMKTAGYDTFAYVADQVLNRKIFKYGFGEFQSQPDNSAVSNEVVNKIKNIGAGKFFIWAHYKIPNVEGLDYTNRLYSCSEDINGQTDNQFMQAYSKNISKIDSEIGRVISTLSEAKSGKNTIVVVLGGRGENFDPKYFGLGKTLYESDVKIIFMIYDPSKKTQKIDLTVDNSKVADMILGKAIKNNFNEKISALKESGLTYFRISYGKNLKVGVSDGKSKFIYNLVTDSCLPEKDASEFYDLIANPGGDGKDNLMDDPDKQAKIQQMRDSLSKETRVPIPKPGEEVNVLDRLRNLGY